MLGVRVRGQGRSRVHVQGSGLVFGLVLGIGVRGWRIVLGVKA